MLRSIVKTALPVLVLAIGIGGYVYLAETRPLPQPGAVESQVWPVAATTVVLADHQPVLRLYGEIVAGREADIRAAVAGEVADVGSGFRDGAAVDEGALLVAVDPFDSLSELAERRAQLDEAVARLVELEARRDMEAAALEHDREILALVERDVERRESLSARGAVSDQALDDVRRELFTTRQAVSMRESNLAAEEARIAQQRAAIVRLDVAVQRAERDYERTRIVAPFAGLLDDTAAELGQRLSVNEAVARLIDPTRLEVRFQVAEMQFGRLLADAEGLIGSEATVVWQVGDATLTVPAAIERLDASVRPESGGVTVYGRLEGLGPETSLRPGAFVEVQMPDRIYRDVARLPAAALLDGGLVYVIGRDDRIELRSVTVAAAVDGAVLVSAGLRSGERVVASRFTEIAPGALVEVVEPLGDSAVAEQIGGASAAPDEPRPDRAP